LHTGGLATARTKERREASDDPMKTVRDACKLQDGALFVKLSDQIEHLDELIHVEGDGSAFFEKTHITHGMQDLISEGIARLAGASTQGVFHLKQAMGGGKTDAFFWGEIANQIGKGSTSSTTTATSTSARWPSSFPTTSPAASRSSVPERPAPRACCVS